MKGRTSAFRSAPAKSCHFSPWFADSCLGNGSSRVKTPMTGRKTGILFQKSPPSAVGGGFWAENLQLQPWTFVFGANLSCHAGERAFLVQKCMATSVGDQFQEIFWRSRAWEGVCGPILFRHGRGRASARAFQSFDLWNHCFGTLRASRGTRGCSGIRRFPHHSNHEDIWPQIEYLTPSMN